MKSQQPTASTRLLARFVSVAAMLLVLGTQSVIMGQSADPAPTLRLHQLQVSRHTGVQLAEQDVEQTLAEMNKVLRASDGPNDVPCDVEFVLEGSITTFTHGIGMVANEHAFVAISELPGHVKIVDVISWCHDRDDQKNTPINFTIGGCASGGSFVTVDPSSLVTEDPLHVLSLAGSLWSHEFGHVMGLWNRIDTPQMVMNDHVVIDSREISAFECSMYLASAPPQ